MDRCAECGFEYQALPRTAVPAAVRQLAVQYRARLRGTGWSALRRRPAAGVWSPLEYAVHVSEVLDVQRDRVALAQRVERPVWTTMHADVRVEARRYNERDPTVVASELVDAADRLARELEALDDPGWWRQGVYVWPSPATRPVLWVARHTVHEMVHHLFDMARSLQPTPGSASG